LSVGLLEDCEIKGTAHMHDCAMKYVAKPPKNADKASSRLTTNKMAAINNVTSHCHTNMRFICVGIVNF